MFMQRFGKRRCRGDLSYAFVIGVNVMQAWVASLGFEMFCTEASVPRDFIANPSSSMNKNVSRRCTLLKRMIVLELSIVL